MKTILILMMLIFSNVTMAATEAKDFNLTCKTIYGDGVQEMLNLIENFHDLKISKDELAVKSLAVSAEVESIRILCAFAEDPAVKPCVKDYKALYKEIRETVNSGALLTGNQQEVDFNILKALKTKFALKIIDLRCGRQSN